ncbi:hypothetical protein AAG906_030368 [Vitis piasezkii]
MGWGSLHWLQHSPASWPAKIWGEEVRNVDSSAGIHNGWLFLGRCPIQSVASIMCWEGQARWSMPLRFASGQSSTITGTYAGQYIMQGFLDIKMRKWLRNLMTRSIAITSSLIVSIIGGSAGAGRLIIIASMILSFELPFALIPLLKFSSSNTKMGPHKNSIYIIVISWILGFGIIGINIYYLSTGFVDWLLHNNLPSPRWEMYPLGS